MTEKQRHNTPSLRSQWITGIIGFPFLGAIAILFVSCMCNIGRTKGQAMFWFNGLVWLRLWIGLFLKQPKRILYVYSLLPIPVALLLNLFTALMFDH